MNQDTREVEAGRNLLGQQYPTGRVQRVCHPPRHRRRSSRRRWGHRPIAIESAIAISNEFDILTSVVDGDRGCVVSDEIADEGELGRGLRKSLGGGCNHTSGNVPLEKTLWDQSAIDLCKSEHWIIHQQAGLSASTIADNDEFATDFSHDGCWGPR